MSERKDQEYFSDGLAEELLYLLSKVAGLEVIARTSSFSFKGKSADMTMLVTTRSCAG
jgi:TolB-like protein